VNYYPKAQNGGNNIDTENQFTKITFDGVNFSRDWFGFDDFTIGTKDQVVSPTPEPATILLFSSGLVGLVALKRKKTKYVKKQRIKS
jgi:hypothetical protein